MATLFIEYHADNGSMGDTSDEHCNQYRAWAKSQIQTAYPNHTVTVSDKPSLHNVLTDDEENRGEIEDFCDRLWDRCPWDF